MWTMYEYNNNDHVLLNLCFLFRPTILLEAENKQERVFPNSPNALYQPYLPSEENDRLYKHKWVTNILYYVCIYTKYNIIVKSHDLLAL